MINIFIFPSQRNRGNYFLKKKSVSVYLLITLFFYLTIKKHYALLINGQFKDALSGLRQLSETESPLNMTKNALYFTSKALFILKIFKFLQ